MTQDVISFESTPIRIEFDPLVHRADWHFAFQLMDDDVNPSNTSGYTCAITISAGQNGEVYDELSIGDGITMTAATGLFAVDLDDEVVDTYDWQTAEFLVIVTDNLGGKTPYFLGQLKFAR